MNIQDFNNLTEDPGNVPWPVKITALVFIAAVIIFIGYKLIIVDELNELETVERKEHDLRQTFETRQQRASQLPQYQSQLEEMQRSFGVLLRQLPSDTEIPGLILDISEKGLSNGLELALFEPRPEVSMEFYTEKPIKIIAQGSYRELATFVSDLSGLSRIVTISDIDLKPEDQDKDQRLRMEATVKTYRYLSEAEQAELNAKKITGAAGANTGAKEKKK